MNKQASWGGFVAIFTILLILLSVGFYYISGNLGSADSDSFNVTVDYPLKIKSLVDKPINYELRDLDGTFIEKGVLKPSVTELYLGAKHNKSYELHVTSDYYYHSVINCDQKTKDSFCMIKPVKIAEPSIEINNGQLIIDTGGDLLKKLLVCSAWKYPSLSVQFPDLDRHDIPLRLVHKLDKCYYVGNVQEKTVLGFEVVKAERSSSLIDLWLIDLDVDDLFYETYEVDSGHADIIYTFEDKH